MKKILLVSGLLVSTVLFASAARTITGATLNGGATVTVAPGESITAIVTGSLSSGDDWEGTNWGVASNTSLGSCENTSDATSNGNHSRSFTITAPSTPGTYNANFAIDTSDDCGGSQSATLTMTNAVTVLTPVASGPRSGSTFSSSDNGGGVGWVNPSNAQSSNNAYATADLDDDGDDRNSDYLNATGYGFSIPSGATVTGIEVKVERSASNSNEVRTETVQLIKAGNRVGDDYDGSSQSYNWGTTDATSTFGGSSDMWGTTWTPAEINASNFGVAFVARNDNDENTQARVDQITITVYYVTTVTNTAPVANTQSISTNEDTAKAITLTGSDVDLNALTFATTSNPSNGTLSGFNASTGAVTYTPNANYNGSDSFSFKVNDGTVDSTTATVTITVTAVNDAPVLTAVTNQSVNELVNLSFSLSASDVDSGSLTYSLTTPLAGASITSGGLFSWTPTEAQGPGTYSLTAQVSDGALTDSKSFDVTVNEVNATPSVTGTSVATHQNTALNITLTASDVDVPVQTLTYTVSEPAHGDLSGTAPNLTYTPDTNYEGSDSFTFKVNDGVTDSSTVTVNISVDNNTPVINEIADIESTDELVAISFTVTADDGDEEATDTLTFSAGNGFPEGATISESGEFSWTPTESQDGTSTMTVVVSDGSRSSEDTFTIYVNEVNLAPTVQGQGEMSQICEKVESEEEEGEGESLCTPAVIEGVETDEDTPVTITLSGSDADIAVQTLTYSTTTSPENGTLGEISGNQVIYTPNANFYGIDSFSFLVNDGVTNSETATVYITVDSVNDAPVITLVGSNPLLLTLGYSNYTDPLATATDVEDGDLSGIVQASGPIDTSALATYTVTYSVMDSDEATASTERLVTILPQSGGAGGTNGVPGCKDPTASNYDPTAIYDGSCTYAPVVLGASTSTAATGEGTTTPAATGEVLGAATSTTPLTCSEYLTLSDSLSVKYMREGIKNNPSDVVLLQRFLNEQLQTRIPITGFFGPITTAAVKRFQLLHKDTILKPWGLTAPTGIVYVTTLAHINNVKCPELNIQVDPKDLTPAQ